MKEDKNQTQKKKAELKKKSKVTKDFKDKYFAFYDDIKTSPKEDW